MGTALLTTMFNDPTCKILLHRKGLNNLDVKMEGSTKFKNLKARGSGAQV